MKVLIIKNSDKFGDWVRPGAYDTITSEKGHKYTYLDCNDRFVMIQDKDGNQHLWLPTAFHGLIVDETDTRGQSSQDPTYTLFKEDVLTILDALDEVDALNHLSSEQRDLRASMSTWLHSIRTD